MCSSDLGRGQGGALGEERQTKYRCLVQCEVQMKETGLYWSDVLLIRNSDVTLPELCCPRWEPPARWPRAPCAPCQGPARPCPPCPPPGLPAPSPRTGQSEEALDPVPAEGLWCRQRLQPFEATVAATDPGTTKPQPTGQVRPGRSPLLGPAWESRRQDLRFHGSLGAQLSSVVSPSPGAS